MSMTASTVADWTSISLASSKSIATGDGGLLSLASVEAPCLKVSPVSPSSSLGLLASWSSARGSRCPLDGKLWSRLGSTTDEEALAAFQLCSTLEGIIPALEPAHALARVGEIAKELGKDKIVVMNLCGRGDKDIFTVADALGRSI